MSDIADEVRYLSGDDSTKMPKRSTKKPERKMSSDDLAFDSKSFVNGIIMSEILGKPKSKQKSRRKLGWYFIKPGGQGEIPARFFVPEDTEPAVKNRVVNYVLGMSWINCSQLLIVVNLNRQDYYKGVCKCLILLI